MLYVIYNTKTAQFRSNESDEHWDVDINHAAIYRTEKSAIAKLKAQQSKWTDYHESWVGHPNHAIAVKNFNTWKTAEVRKAKLELI
jgi:hypothetical protein